MTDETGDAGAFTYTNMDGWRRGPFLTVAGLVLRGVAKVQGDVRPFAEAWRRDNLAALRQDGPLWVALGDSLTLGIGAPAHDRGWVGQLRARLARDGRRFRVVDLAVSGATTEDVLERQLPVLERLPEPDLVTLMVGSNDLVRPSRRTAFVEHYGRLLQRLPEGTVVATLPNPSRPAREAADLLARVAAERGLVVAELRDPRTSSWRGKLAADRFHPNEAGHAALADVMGDAVVAALARRR